MMGDQEVRTLNELYQDMIITVHVTTDGDRPIFQLDTPGKCRDRSVMHRNCRQLDILPVDNNPHFPLFCTHTAWLQLVRSISGEITSQISEVTTSTV